MTTRRRVLTRGAAVLGAASTGLLLPQIVSAQSQGYPSRPVRLICPYAAGGSTDIISRAIAQEMSEVLGQPFIVENRVGAGPNVGSEMAARSAPDGYTMVLTASSTHGIIPALYTKLNYDPNKDFAPVVVLVAHRYVLLVKPTMNARSVKDIIQLAKAQPGKLTFASGGSGSTTHMAGEMFKQMAGVDIAHIPYKGSTPAQADLLGGHVDMMFGDIPGTLAQIKAGKMRALGVSGEKREALLPDVPTIAESGVPGYEASVWMGLAVPSGTPKEIISKLNAAALQGSKSPAFRKRMVEVGMDIVASTPEQMNQMIKVAIEQWGPVVKASGAKAD
ncbi:tripartite tricarboxylate transporter substrate binding protein [Ramlibacter henchirensis]|uniref:Tripartite tricarboxylate transporter substrate binding protein n=1 Tax=Ramlibacter henchirensis TaxID=204072 RepID=A0A4Z0BUE3_9BURK|nr:tripartite tricarboxylate transporter substrate binding protein [Ramlibacter henchirensis]TFZ02923.1 tripartite tricarboxylate transporter substrate binding protein [Ramlibacter henchirensis]